MKKPGCYFVRFLGEDEWTIVRVVGPENFSRQTFVYLFGRCIPLQIEDMNNCEWGDRINLPDSIVRDNDRIKATHEI